MLHYIFHSLSCMLGWTPGEILGRLERQRGSNSSFIAHTHCFRSAKPPPWGETASGSATVLVCPGPKFDFFSSWVRCLLALWQRTLGILQDTLVDKIQGKSCSMVSWRPPWVLACARGFQLSLGLLHFASTLCPSCFSTRSSHSRLATGAWLAPTTAQFSAANYIYLPPSDSAFLEWIQLLSI